MLLLLFSLSKVKLPTEIMTYSLSLNQHLISSYCNIFLLPHVINARTSQLWKRGCSCCDLHRRGEYKMQHNWLQLPSLRTNSQPGLPLCHTQAQEDEQILGMKGLGIQRISGSSSHFWVSFGIPLPEEAFSWALLGFSEDKTWHRKEYTETRDDWSFILTLEICIFFFLHIVNYSNSKHVLEKLLFKI